MFGSKTGDSNSTVERKLLPVRFLSDQLMRNQLSHTAGVHIPSDLSCAEAIK